MPGRVCHTGGGEQRDQMLRRKVRKGGSRPPPLHTHTPRWDRSQLCIRAQSRRGHRLQGSPPAPAPCAPGNLTALPATRRRTSDSQMRPCQDGPPSGGERGGGGGGQGLCTVSSTGTKGNTRESRTENSGICARDSPVPLLCSSLTFSGFLQESHRTLTSQREVHRGGHWVPKGGGGGSQGAQEVRPGGHRWQLPAPSLRRAWCALARRQILCFLGGPAGGTDFTF